MHSTQFDPSLSYCVLDGWSAPHQGLASAPANGSRLHSFDASHTNHHRRRGTSDIFSQHMPHSRPVVLPPRGDWRPARGTLFFSAARPYQHLSAELEPLPQYVASVREAQYYPPRVAAFGSTDDDESYDISALADQFLDLSEHCPVPSRSTSPSAGSARSCDTIEVELPPSKRRRINEWDLPRLPPVQMPDDEGDQPEYSGDRQTGLSPFYHPPSPSPSPSHDVELPASLHHSHVHTHTHTHTHTNTAYTHATHTASRPAPPALKFTEARKDGRSKRQALACLFCRARKIACGRPNDGSGDQTCNQCARRRVQCVYPTESRRGQHSRIKSLARRAQLTHNVGMLLPLLPT